MLDDIITVMLPIDKWSPPWPLAASVTPLRCTRCSVTIVTFRTSFYPLQTVPQNMPSNARLALWNTQQPHGRWYALLAILNSNQHLQGNRQFNILLRWIPAWQTPTECQNQKRLPKPLSTSKSDPDLVIRTQLRGPVTPVACPVTWTLETEVRSGGRSSLVLVLQRFSYRLGPLGRQAWRRKASHTGIPRRGTWRERRIPELHSWLEGRPLPHPSMLLSKGYLDRAAANRSQDLRKRRLFRYIW